MAQYYSDELDTEFFRLATISPGIHPDTKSKVPSVTLTKHHLPGTSELAYNALSYTWGLERDGASVPQHATQTSILLNGKPFEAQSNLYNALQELQVSCSETPIWIDALCINQSSPTERASQVSVMHKIYGEAKSVIVWLGKASPELEAGLRAAERIGTQSVPEIVRMVGSQTWDFSSDLSTMPERYSMDPITQEEAIGLVTVYMSNWFSRIWIIQEVSLASNVVILCNGKFTPFECVGCTSGFLHYSGFFQAVFSLAPRDRGIFFCAGINVFHAERILLFHEWCKGEKSKWAGVVATIDIDAGLGGHTKSPAMFLLRLLFPTVGFQATDSQDSIYRLVGILKHMAASEGLSLPQVYEPSYIIRIKDLLRNVACDIIEETDSLVYLSLVKDPSMRGTPGLPSWVPNFPPVGYNSVHGPNFKSIGTVNSSKHIPHTPNPYPFTITGNVLNVFGHCLGSVTKTAENYFEAAQGRLSKLVDMLLSMDETYRYTNQPADEVLWRTLIWDTDFTNRPSKLITLEDFQSAILNGIVLAFQILHADADSTAAGQAFVLESVRNLSYLDEVAAKFPNSIFPSTKLIKTFCASLGLIPQGSDESDHEELQRLKEPRSTKLMSPKLIMASTWIYRRPVLTDTGYLGMGFEGSQVGDEIWIISGCPAPMTLRKMEGDKEYCLIGEAYVHRVMQGEAVTDEITWEKIEIV